MDDATLSLRGAHLYANRLPSVHELVKGRGGNKRGTKGLEWAHRQRKPTYIEASRQTDKTEDPRT